MLPTHLNIKIESSITGVREAVCRSTKHDCDKQSTNAAASDGGWCSQWRELVKHTCDTCNRRTHVYKEKRSFRFEKLHLWHDSHEKCWVTRLETINRAATDNNLHGKLEVATEAISLSRPLALRQWSSSCEIAKLDIMLRCTRYSPKAHEKKKPNIQIPGGSNS